MQLDKVLDLISISFLSLSFSFYSFYLLPSLFFPSSFLSPFHYLSFSLPFFFLTITFHFNFCFTGTECRRRSHILGVTFFKNYGMLSKSKKSSPIFIDTSISNHAIRSDFIFVFICIFVCVRENKRKCA